MSIEMDRFPTTLVLATDGSENTAQATRAAVDIRPKTRAVAGEPAEVLLEAAQEGERPTLVAVGSRGLGPVGRLRLGSVSTRVIRAGQGAVLVYPPAGDRSANG